MTMITYKILNNEGIQDASLFVSPSGRIYKHNVPLNGVTVTDPVEGHTIERGISDDVINGITKELTERICRYDSGGLIKGIIKKHLNQKTS